MRAAITAAAPAPLVRHALTAPDVVRLLTAARSVDVIAAGKSAGPMLDALPDDLPYRVVMAAGSPRSVPGRTVEWHAGAHPLPDGESVAAGRRAMHVAASAAPDDLVLVLLSGGASSMMAMPAEGISLEDKRETIRRLLMAGATIDELNTVRKHVSAIKGGRLAAATRATVVTLAISDVVGDDPSTIASGPTVGDPTTFAAALAVLESRGGGNGYPPLVTRRLQAGAAGAFDETPKPGAAALSRAHMTVVGGRRQVLGGAAAAAAALGYRVRILDRPTIGEAREAGPRLLAEAMREAGAGVPVCVLAGGETTVTVRGHGRGGRNQELALSIAPLLHAGTPSIAVASAGTDGIDGPTDAAGAIVDQTTVSRAAAAGLSVEAALDDNNSYAFFDSLGDVIRPGPTGVNAGDLQVVLLTG